MRRLPDGKILRTPATPLERRGDSGSNTIRIFPQVDNVGVCIRNVTNKRVTEESDKR